MSPIILHHYATSPFSEKIRLILGYKRVAWQSVFIPQIMPKPDVVALTGGYRRTPFMQIGAHVYCDTALMCDELERRFPSPTLYPTDANAAVIDTLARWGDTELFWSGVVGYVFQPAGVAAMFDGVSPEALKAFGADRAQMRAGAPRTPPPEAAGMLRIFLQRIEAMLSAQPYLLSSAPSLADFSVYHPLWFVRKVAPIAHIFDATPNVLAWMDRMAAIGHGEATKLSSADAISIASNASPEIPEREWHDEHGLKRADRVTITPLDYALDPVAGELVISAKNELAVRRVDPRAGDVVVHFPRVGFRMEREKI